MPLLFLSLIIFTGCSGGKVGVSGKVTFEDGTPLSKGEVTFQTGDYSASGKVNPDGTYTISSTGNNDGLKPGLYKVTVIAVEYDSNLDLTDDPNRKVAGPKVLVDPKFNSVETSGLSCDVKGKTTYDIKVTAP